MNRTDRILERLFKAAAKASPEAPAAVPLGLETRVLANWRAARAEDDWASLFLFFRRAVVGAGLALVLCAAWSFAQTGGSATGDEAARLNYEIQMSLNP
jgi:hypothetical protein